MEHAECERQLNAAVAVLVRALASRSARLRQVAANALAEIAGPALPTLARALRDGDPAVRAAASRLIGDIRRQNSPGMPCHQALGKSAAALVELFASHSGPLRQEARRVLVGMGGYATDALARGLGHPHVSVRWESAKALGDIADPRAAPDLVAALEDGVFDVRWLAGEALINIEEAALEPLLQALVDRPHSARLQEGAHHVLRVLAEHGFYTIAAPVVRALEGFDPSLGVGPVAYEALQRLHGGAPPETFAPEEPPSAPEEALTG